VITGLVREIPYKALSGFPTQGNAAG